MIDERVAADSGLRVDDTVTVLGGEHVIGGLARGTVNVVNSIAFVRFDDFEEATRVNDTASFGLVRVARGQDPAAVASRIRKRVGGLSVMTREQFAENERRIVSDMSIDIMRIMNLIAFFIGVAVVGLTVYTSTFAKLREYGVLKAMGARSAVLFGVVFSQAALSVSLGLVLAVALGYAVAGALLILQSQIEVRLTILSVVRVATASAVIAILASAVPIAMIARIKPADVLRR